MSAGPAPILMPMQALAAQLGLQTASAARRFALREGLPLTRLGARRLGVRVASFDAWLAARETATPGPRPALPPPQPPAWAQELLRGRCQVKRRRRRGLV